MFDGILLVNKPLGWTSFDVVAKIRGILSKEYLETTGQKKKIKVGHTGTLDPLASGLMIVVVGSYCKRASEFSKLDKVYEVQMKLGQTSTTGDEEGDKSDVGDKVPPETEIISCMDGFLGETMQTPPAFSAIKINGKRAYDLARTGQKVVLESRKITIYDIKLLKYDYPLVDFNVNVSSGTYIRSLVEDIGRQLKTGAYITKLNRSSVGSFSIDNAIEITEINSKSLNRLKSGDSKTT